RGALVDRLGPALSAPEFWVMEGEQKRAALFAPAEERELEVAAAPGSRLRFSLATLKGAPARGWIALGAPRIVAPIEPAERKVLVWISVDTLRADHVGAYGYGRATSPV